MSGTVKTDFVCLRSTVTSASPVGSIHLAWTGADLVLVDSAGISTVITGSSATALIGVADNTTPAFRVYNLVTNDNYILAETVTGSETLTVGKAALTATAVDGQTVAITSTDTISAIGGGNVLINSTAGSTTIKGGATIDIGGVGISSIDIAATGARTTRVGNTLATSTTVAAAANYTQMNSTGITTQIKNGAALSVTEETSGTNVFDANFGAPKPVLVLGDLAAVFGVYVAEDLGVGVDLTVEGTSLFYDEVTVDADLILDGGQNVRVGSGGAIALTVDSAGDITAFGQTAPGATGDVLTWDGAKYIPSTPAAPGTTLSVIQQRIQLADLTGLGAVATTGAVSFGTSIDANTVVMGAFLYLNVDPNVDTITSGITNLKISVGAANSNIYQEVELVGETGAPKYLNGSSISAGDFNTGPFIDDAAGQPVYEITATGGNLGDMGAGAFDVTVGVIVSTLTLTVP